MRATEKDLEKSIEDSTEGVIEEPEEKSTKNSVEEQIEEPTEEAIEAPIEEPIEESIEESVEEPIEESKEEVKDKLKEKKKRIAIGIIASVCSFLIIYFGMTKYFTNHFYYGSAINSISVSGKTVEDAKMLVAYELQNYTLNIKERAGKVEQIQGGDVGLKYKSDEEFNKFKDRQNPFNWFFALFNSKDLKTTVGLSHDEKLLRERIDSLSCFDRSNIIEPRNPGFQYMDNAYAIVDEVPGNKVDKEILYTHLAEVILKGETEIDLEISGCYIEPQYTSKSPKIIEVKDTLNKYVSSKITYTIGEGKETLSGSIINKWISVNENFEVTVDEKKVEEYLQILFMTYNTIGKTRSFIGSSGKIINVGDGDYGWSIDITEETHNLITSIKEGQILTKEPVYSQTAFSHGNNDIGNTYVEIDIDKQHIWFYKDGSLIVEGDIVTGNVRNNTETPRGIYRLKYKKKNAVLRGPGYAAPVTFWMPFNGGVGLHDANWRSKFGGSIYKTDGSHGCVNMPYSVAKAIFNNIEENTPVICY